MRLLVSTFVTGSGRAGLMSGALAAALVTPPLIGLMYLLDQIFGFPFVPFALFDWLSRVLPGTVITFGLDFMIDGMRLVGLVVADAAKIAEQLGAVLLFFLICVSAGAIFFAITRARSANPQLSAGLVLGAVPGIPMTAIGIQMTQSSLPFILVLLETMALFLVWGLSFVAIYRRLVLAKSDIGITQAGVRSVHVIGRRQFLIRLGATTATITLLSGSLGTLLAQSERRQINETIARSRDMSGTGSGVTFPNANDPVMPAPGTRLEYTPVEEHYKVFIGRNLQ